GPAQADADRRADHRRALARGCGTAHRACARAGRRGRRRQADDRVVAQEESQGSEIRERADMKIDLPDVVAEVTAAFERYERALGANDVATLNTFFRDDSRTIRYGIAENLYGHAEIAAFRGARSPIGMARTISRTVITTYGRDFAVASTLFDRASAPGKIGRQMQTWVRFDDGWHVVAAHVSMIAAPKGPPA